MPKRNRHREAVRGTRRERREAERPVPRTPTEDEVWAEHQEFERWWRAGDPYDEQVRRAEQAARMRAELGRAVRAVERDFAEWRSTGPG
jgi:hypothetical protein